MARNGTQQRGLFESERRFRLLVEGIVDYAINMLDPHGIVTNWNAGAKRIKGYEAREVIGRHFEIFYLPEDRAAGIPARSLATAREKGKFEAEGWRLRKDGMKFLASVVIDAIYEDGELIGFAKITRDITEQNKSSEALKESERHFRLLVNGVTDYALYMLDPNGIVTNWKAGGRAPCSSHGRMAVTKKKAGASARTARSFGRALSSIPFVTMTTSFSALP